MGKRGWVKDPEALQLDSESYIDVSNKGAYRNLMNQLNKAARHSKGVSIPAQRQYYNHVDQFCRFVADEYNLKNLANIHDKHMVAYIIDRQAEGKSPSTIKLDLAAIRYFHDQIPKTRHYLSDNNHLAKKYNSFSLAKRQFGGINRRTTELEYHGLVNLAEASKQPETARIIQLAREQGLRIHEITRLDRSDAEQALRTNELTVKGKGGLIRTIPLRNQIKTVLQTTMDQVKRGHKLFVKENEKTHTVIQRVKDFVRNHRNKVLDPAHHRPEHVPVTMHGFRHAYAKEEYNRFIAKGLSEKEARFQTSLLIGHSRQDVTRIYLED